MRIVTTSLVALAAWGALPASTAACGRSPAALAGPAAADAASPAPAIGSAGPLAVLATPLVLPLPGAGPEAAATASGFPPRPLDFARDSAGAAAPPGADPPASAAVEEPPPAAEPPWRSGLLRADRLQHISFSLSLGLSFGVLIREPVAALGGAMVLGVLKEVRDARHGRFDWVDLAADAIGAVAATILTSGLLR